MELSENEAEGTGGRAAASGLGARATQALRRTLSPAELASRQELYNGFGNGLAVAFEMAVVPFIFGFGGWALDRWLGTAPVFMILLALIAIVGLFVRAWCDYEQRMKAHDAGAIWSRDPLRPGPVGQPLRSGHAGQPLRSGHAGQPLRSGHAGQAQDQR